MSGYDAPRRALIVRTPCCARCSPCVLLRGRRRSSTSRTPTAGPGRRLRPGAGLDRTRPCGLVCRVSAALVVLRRDPRQRFGWAARLASASSGALDGLAQSYVRFGRLGRRGAPRRRPSALWFLSRFTAFLPVTIAVLLLIFPTGRFLPGALGSGRPVQPRRSCACGCHGRRSWRRPTGGCSTSTFPPGVDLDAGHAPASPPSHRRPVLPVATSLTVVGVLVAMATVVVRHRRVRRRRARPDALAALVRDRDGAVVLASRLLFDLTVARATSMTVRGGRAAGRRDDHRRSSSPTLVPIEDLLGAHPRLRRARRWSLVAVDLAVARRPHRAARRRPRRSARSCWSCCC